VMFNLKNLHSDESGLSALETAIILIAFIVVASVFAFAILSAGTASTERGQEAIYAGLEEVQSSMEIRGAVIGKDEGGSGAVQSLVFTVALVSGGDPLDLNSDAASRVVTIGYRDNVQQVNNLDYTVAFIGANDADTLLEGDELAEITVDLSGLTTALGPNTEFTIEVKPPTGAVLNIQHTTPAAIEAVMELH
jgi:flagellin FlaB